MISFQNISKAYNFAKKIDSIRGFFSAFFEKNTKKHPFFALQHINFEVQKGEILGIIGRNGAGKSTLLKILSRIEKPTTGIITLEGNLQSLLEVGTGFHQDLTGRENIWLNGGLLGMSYQEIQAKFEQIVHFSELSAFIDMPLSQYSSGMAMRLAFSVAVHLESDILVLDEVLAVGDDAFQKKCIQKILDFKANQKTIILVSHQLALVQKLCNRVIWLDNGQIKHIGNPHETIEKYIAQQISGHHFLQEKLLKKPCFDLTNATRTQEYTLKKNILFKEILFNKNIYFPDDIFRVSVFLEENFNKKQKNQSINQQKHQEIAISIAIFNQYQERIYHLNNLFLGKKWIFSPEKGYNFTLSPLRLQAGIYSLNLYLESNESVEDWIQQQVHFEVQTGHIYPSEQHFNIRALVQVDFGCE